MDAMLKALRSKREGKGMMMPEIKESKMDLDAIVSQLSADDKIMLIEKLTNEKKSDDMPIDKGGMTDDEKEKIKAKMVHEGMETEEEEEEEHEDEGPLDSDAIAMQMVNNKFKGVEDGTKARNLSERVQMEMAKKLKEKGKI